MLPMKGSPLGPGGRPLRRRSESTMMANMRHDSNRIHPVTVEGEVLTAMALSDMATQNERCWGWMISIQYCTDFYHWYGT